MALRVDSERCTGCGACVDVCPAGAIRLVDHLASIDAGLCRECQACMEVCPQGAIFVAEERVPVVVEGEIVGVSPNLPVVQQPASAPVRPIRPRSYNLGMALAFLGREIIPRAAAYLLEAWRHRQTTPDARGRAALGISLLDHWRWGGHRQRQRQRRGR